jgi:hypothetical protein
VLSHGTATITTLICEVPVFRRTCPIKLDTYRSGPTPTDTMTTCSTCAPRTAKDFNRKLRRFMHTSQRSNGLRRRQKRNRLGMRSRR